MQDMNSGAKKPAFITFGYNWNVRITGLANKMTSNCTTISCNIQSDIEKLGVRRWSGLNERVVS